MLDNVFSNLQLIVLVSVDWLKYQTTQIDSHISKSTQEDKIQREDRTIRHDQGIQQSSGQSHCDQNVEIEVRINKILLMSRIMLPSSLALFNIVFWTVYMDVRG